jgi:hypothetical protein
LRTIAGALPPLRTVEQLHPCRADAREFASLACLISRCGYAVTGGSPLCLEER